MATRIPDTTTLKMAKAKITTDANGDGTVLLKVPGTPGSGDGRAISLGHGWFDTPHEDDSFCIYITDEDDILGYGAGATIESYTDDAAPSANQGWYIPKVDGKASVEAMGEVKGFLPSGLYLKIVVKKGTATVDTFRANVGWGER